MENMHSDVTVKRVKNNATFPKKFYAIGADMFK